MKRNFITGFVSGALICGAAAVVAANYTATENQYPVQLNGNNVNVEGYNIDGYTYFKLRDIADTVGGFTVDFQNDTIQLAKDGYSYDNDANTGIVLTDNMIKDLSEICVRLQGFIQQDVNTDNFVRTFVFCNYSGSDTYDLIDNGRYGWSEDKIKHDYLLLFGQEMPEFYPADGSIVFDNGYYWISMGNYGDEQCVFQEIVTDGAETDVIFKHTDSTGSDFGKMICHLAPADNENGYIITAITRI
jgi:hypothetical protein